MTRFTCLEDIVAATAESVRPPERLTIAEAAERYHYVNLPGTHVGPFSFEKTPYLVEPQNSLNSLDFTGMIFAGPARTGKSAMGLNWVASTAICDPADMMFFNMTQSTARDWSQGDFARMVRHSPEVAKRMTPGRQNDNTHDKRFLSGMRLLIKWPTITEMSGKTIPRLWLFDYDRMPQDVDGEGNPFDLARKRAQTFGRYGMCVAEASPGFTVRDPKWIATSPHEAPPTGDEKGGGILQIYNRGDRRRWYWMCPHCGEPFEGDFKHLTWPDSADHLEAAEAAVLNPPCCGADITHDMKFDLNLGGKWVKDGQTLHADGSITGTARRSDIASFWLKGPAAAFADWKTLVFRYLQAEEIYAQTGNEENLKTTVTVDQGLPYTPRALEAGRLPEDLKERAEDWGGSADAPVVPEGVRFLIKTIDVQARSFVVQTHGFTADNDALIIETKKLRRSVMTDDNGEWLPIDPATRPEDWDVLIPEIEQLYPLADGSDRFMGLRLVGCDSGGAEGVTSNAYAFVRRLRETDSTMHERFCLLKGVSPRGWEGLARLRISYPDSKRKDRHAGARGEIPVWLVNSNAVKDQASAMLGRTEPGNQVRFPAWAEDWLWKQLTAEVRTPKGWDNLTRRRNEAWDLLVYALALLLHRLVNAERIDWGNPPGFAAEWDQNTMIVSGNKSVAKKDDGGASDLASLAEKLG